MDEVIVDHLSIIIIIGQVPLIISNASWFADR